MRAIYSSFSSATHHIFFPPRFQFVALQQDADRLPAHLRRQFPPDRFGGDEPHCPSRLALGRRTTDNGDDPLTLSRVKSALLTRSRLFMQRRFQSFLFVAPGDGSHSLRRHARIVRNLCRLLSFVKLAKNRSAPQHPRRFTPLRQQCRKMPPVPHPQLNMHPVIGLHVPTMRPLLSAKQCLIRYIFTRSE